MVFRPGWSYIGLFSHRDLLESRHFVYRKWMHYAYSTANKNRPDCVDVVVRILCRSNVLKNCISLYFECIHVFSRRVNTDFETLPRKCSLLPTCYVKNNRLQLHQYFKSCYPCDLRVIDQPDKVVQPDMTSYQGDRWAGIRKIIDTNYINISKAVTPVN